MWCARRAPLDRLRGAPSPALQSAEGHTLHSTRKSAYGNFGTPYTSALHVVERYRLLDYEDAKDGLEWDAKENSRVQVFSVDRNYRGKHLQLEFTVEDEGAFTTPWRATITHLPSLGQRQQQLLHFIRQPEDNRKWTKLQMAL